MVEKLAIYLAPFLSFSSTKYDADNVFRSMYYGLDAGLYYALLGDPKAQKGLVPALGAALGLYFDPGVGDIVGGFETTDDSMESYLVFSPFGRLYFFINDRLAFFTILSSRLWYRLASKNSSGIEQDLSTDEKLFLDVTVSFGFSYFIPRKKASLL